MREADAGSPVPVWLRVIVWSVAIAIAAVGVVVAVITSSWWPLIACAALALPLFPVGTPRTVKPTSAESH